MASFNDIVIKAASTDSQFYSERGVTLHNLEVVRYEPKDKETAGVLHKIIQETTNHINRMQQQKSENEVEREKMGALIEIEKQRAGLIKEKTANEKAQAAVDGEADGTRLAQSTLAFMQQMSTSVQGEETRLALLKFFAEQKTAADHCYRGRWRHVDGWRSGQARARDARRDVKVGSRVRGAGTKPWAAETLMA